MKRLISDLVMLSLLSILFVGLIELYVAFTYDSYIHSIFDGITFWPMFIVVFGYLVTTFDIGVGLGGRHPLMGDGKDE